MVKRPCCEYSFVKCEKGQFDCSYGGVGQNDNDVEVLNQSVSAELETGKSKVNTHLFHFGKLWCCHGWRRLTNTGPAGAVENHAAEYDRDALKSFA